MKVEFKTIKPSYMTIDKLTFKYYLGYEIDEMTQGKTSFNQRDIDELYFMIIKKFEPFFKENNYYLEKIRTLTKQIRELKGE